MGQQLLGGDSLPVRRYLKLITFTFPSLLGQRCMSVPQVFSTRNQELCTIETLIHEQAGVSKHKSPDQMKCLVDFFFFLRLYMYKLIT